MVKTGNRYTIGKNGEYITFHHSKNKVYVMLFDHHCIDILGPNDDHVAYLSSQRLKDNYADGMMTLQEIACQV